MLNRWPSKWLRALLLFVAGLQGIKKLCFLKKKKKKIITGTLIVDATRNMKLNRNAPFVVKTSDPGSDYFFLF